MSKNKYIIVISLLIISMVLSSCSKVANEEKNLNETTEPDTIIEEETEEINEVVPTFGETLKLAIRNPRTLNPLLNEDRSVDQVLKLVFEPLFSMDDTYKPVPYLVESYTIESDNSSITLVLKKDHFFHNGELVMAKDVEYSIKVLQEATNNPIYKACVSNIDRTSVIDDYTLKLYLKQPFAFTTYQLNFPIVSKSYATSELYDEFSPIGSGMYKVTGFTPMQELTLTADDKHKELLYIENLKCSITRDDEVDENSFDQTLVDLLMPLKFDWTKYSDDPDNRIFEYTSNYLEFIGFNFKNNLLIDKNIRHAIAYAINREEIAKEQYLAHVTITDGILHPNSYLNTDQEITYNYDIEEAKSLLNKALLTDTDGDGLFDKKIDDSINGINLRLLVNKANLSRMSVAQMLKGYLNDIGLKVTIDAVDATTFNTKLTSGEYDLVLSGWKLSTIPDFTSLFHTSSQEAGSNFIHYSNEFVDNALAGIFNSTTEEVLLTSVQKFNILYEEELPYFSLYFMHSIVKTNKNIYGELKPTTDFSLKGIENLYISR